MHQEAYDFVRRTLAGHRLTGATVLEAGSYNVNGSVRPLFAGCATYTGLDIRRGPGVDVVADAATWAGDGARYDYIVSTEALEHAVDPGAVVANLRRLLSPGGWLILTLASAERQPHGSDGGALPPWESYHRIAEGDLWRWLDGLDVAAVEHHEARGDLYVAALQPIGPPVKDKRRRSRRAQP
jgi:SAM-dependent methyltransferase